MTTGRSGDVIELDSTRPIPATDLVHLKVIVDTIEIATEMAEALGVVRRQGETMRSLMHRAQTELEVLLAVAEARSSDDPEDG